MPSYKPSADSSQSGPPQKMLDRVRDRIRRLGYAKRTELSYAHWIKRFILHHGKRHPAEMGKAVVEYFSDQSGGGTQRGRRHSRDRTLAAAGAAKPASIKFAAAPTAGSVLPVED